MVTGLLSATPPGRSSASMLVECAEPSALREESPTGGEWVFRPSCIPEWLILLLALSFIEAISPVLRLPLSLSKRCRPRRRLQNRSHRKRRRPPRQTKNWNRSNWSKQTRRRQQTHWSYRRPLQWWNRQTQRQKTDRRRPGHSQP